MTDPRDHGPRSEAPAAPPGARVQCSNCCQLAPVTGGSMGLLLYVCELCGTKGAVTRDAVVTIPDST